MTEKKPKTLAELLQKQGISHSSAFISLKEDGGRKHKHHHHKHKKEKEPKKRNKKSEQQTTATTTIGTTAATATTDINAPPPPIPAEQLQQPLTQEQLQQIHQTLVGNSSTTPIPRPEEEEQQPLLPPQTQATEKEKPKNEEEEEKEEISSSCPSTPELANNLSSSDDNNEEDFKQIVAYPHEIFFSDEFLQHQEQGQQQQDLENEGESRDFLENVDIMSDAELIKRRKEKINRLLSLYKIQMYKLRDVLRIKHRKFILKRELERRLTAAAAASNNNNQIGDETTSKTKMQSLNLTPITSVQIPKASPKVSQQQQQIVRINNNSNVIGLNSTSNAVAAAVAAAIKPRNTTNTTPISTITTNMSTSPVLPGFFPSIPPKRRRLGEELAADKAAIQDAFPSALVFKKISDMVSCIQIKRRRLWQAEQKAPKGKIFVPLSAIKSQISQNTIIPNSTTQPLPPQQQKTISGNSNNNNSNLSISSSNTLIGTPVRTLSSHSLTAAIQAHSAKLQAIRQQSLTSATLTPQKQQTTTNNSTQQQN